MATKSAFISTSDVCRAMEVTQETVRGWRERGMPAEKVKGRWRYDVNEVYDWLIESKIAACPEEDPWPVFTNKPPLATFLGVSTRTITEWQAEPGFPGRPARTGHKDGHYPTREIAIWCAERGKQIKLSPEFDKLLRRELPEDAGPGTASYRMTHQDRLIGARADKAELERDLMLGNLLDAEQYYREVARQHSAVVTVLRSLPAKVASLLPTELNEGVKTAVYKAVEQTVVDCREHVQVLLEGDEDDKER